jgi:hypothetical protein
MHIICVGPKNALFGNLLVADWQSSNSIQQTAVRSQQSADRSQQPALDRELSAVSSLQSAVCSQQRAVSRSEISRQQSAAADA